MFHSCIVKLTSFCNLNCSYCYMFNLGDQTYTRVPNNMPVEVAVETIHKIRRYMDVSGVTHFSITLHGGEPTLWPYSSFVHLFAALDQARSQGYHIDVGLQTNAYRPFTASLLRLLDSHRVSLGISLDGPAHIHDKFRVTHSNKGSYAKVLQTVQNLIDAGYKHLIGGFLTVAQPEIPIEEFLNWIETLPVRKVDVLWPIQFNHDTPPWAGMEEGAYAVNPVYGRWFGDLFEAWWRRDDPDLHIRLFYNLLHLYLGSPHHLDVLVNDTLDMFVVNTDGRVEYPDYLRGVTDEAALSAFTIMENDITDFSEDAVFHQLIHLGQSLPVECAPCPHKDVCGGGFLAGRTSSTERITRRKSVLCADQFHFFSAVQNTIRQQRDLCTASSVSLSDGERLS